MYEHKRFFQGCRGNKENLKPTATVPGSSSQKKCFQPTPAKCKRTQYEAPPPEGQYPDQEELLCNQSTAWGPNLGIWILIGYNFNFAVILTFG